MIKTYLGDSVYAEFDGYSIAIYTDNGLGFFNKIYLEPEILKALINFKKECYNEE